VIEVDRLVIGFIVGSTRQNRRAKSVAEWLIEIASTFDADFVLLDLADFPLPYLDAPQARDCRGNGSMDAHVDRWSAAVGGCDGFVIITPEYNHSFPGVLKNAIDYVRAEWENKAVGFVGYGGNGGVRAVEHLRAVAGQLKMADVRAQPALSLTLDFDEGNRCAPRDLQVMVCNGMLDELLSWAAALKPLRERGSSDRQMGVMRPVSP
jgi:NAD(P)H-dependent FMN reductase